jgi:hypothetical protein
VSRKYRRIELRFSPVAYCALRLSQFASFYEPSQVKICRLWHAPLDSFLWSWTERSWDNACSDGCSRNSLHGPEGSFWRIRMALHRWHDAASAPARAQKHGWMLKKDVMVIYVRELDRSLPRTLWGRSALGTDALGNAIGTLGDRGMTAKPGRTDRSPLVLSRTRNRRGIGGGIAYPPIGLN